MQRKPTGATSVAADDRVSVEMTRAQLAHVRRLVTRDVYSLASSLAAQAHEASEVTDSSEGVAAQAMYHVLLGCATEVLDAIGWDTSDDSRLLIEMEKNRRATVGAPTWSLLGSGAVS